MSNAGQIQYRKGPSFLFGAFAVLFLDLLDCRDAVQARIPRLPCFAHTARTDQINDMSVRHFSRSREASTLTLFGP